MAESSVWKPGDRHRDLAVQAEESLQHWKNWQRSYKEGVYGRVSGDTHALLGMKLFAEYLDGIAVVSIAAGTALGE